MTGRITPLGVLLLAMLAGCTGSPSGPDPAELAALRAQVAGLAAQVATLRANERAMTGELVTLERRSDLHQWASAELIPTDTTVRWIDAQPALGPFVVSVQYVRSFADGVRVRLNLGNLTSVAISGAVLKLKYGPPKPEVGDPDYASRFVAWERGLKQRSQEVPGALKPGAWNPVTVVLPGINDRAFGYLQVGLATSTMWPVLARGRP